MLRYHRVTLEQARQAIAVYKTIPIRFVDVEKNGRVFVVRPEPREGSPLDVPGIDLRMTAAEIVQFIQEGRRTGG